MAEFLVSTVLDQLKALAKKKLIAEIKRLVGVMEEVTKLQRILRKIQKGLADADQRQLTETDVSNWLWELKDVSYDIDEVLEKWITSIRKKPDAAGEDENNGPGTKKKGECISKFNLIAGWMAQGYIKERKGEDMEMFGEEYFQDLAARSFFHDFDGDDNDDITEFKIHDMVHEVAQFLSINECCTLEVNGHEEPNDISSGCKPRHSTLLVSFHSQSLSYFDSLDKLRSLFVKSKSQNLHIQPDIFSRLISLRSLNLSRCRVKVIPSTIGELIHLRWLCLSSNGLVELPETICELYYLQTLDIKECVGLEKLPRGIGNLTNLRHFCNQYSGSVLPKGVKDLADLRTLERFTVGDGGVEAASLGDLSNLKHLRGQLCIENLGEAVEVGEAKLFRLDEKNGITDLIIIFQEARKEKRKHEEEKEEEERKHEEEEEEEEEKRKHHDRELLDALKPPSSLAMLVMLGKKSLNKFVQRK